MSLIGHACLAVAISADFLRRNTATDTATVLTISLSILSFLALAIGGILFVMHPRLFFFGDGGRGGLQSQPRLLSRLMAWGFVVITPVLWLLLVDRLPSLLASELLVRFLGSYLFFAWVATAMIVSPWLFRRST